MCSWRNRGGRRPADAGITLIELLVAVVLSVVLMASIYYIYSITTRSHRVQGEVMMAMEQARFGLDQIRRDIAAAGFMGTPNSARDTNVCPKTDPDPPIRGIQFQRVGDVAPGNPNVTPSAVILFGAYFSPNVFFTDHIAGSDVFFQWAGLPALNTMPQTQTAFEDTFRPGRYLRIVNAEQYESYYVIQRATWASNPAQRKVTLARTPPVSTPPDYCGVQGFAVGLETSVAGYVRYRLATDTRVANGTKVDLVREEWDALNQVWVQRLVIAEYAADLQFYDFARDAGSLTTPQILFDRNVEDIVSSGGTGRYGNDVTATPERLRFVTAKLTMRTVFEDPATRFVPRPSAHAPFDTYEVDTTVTGAARVVSLASRVGLKAFLVRNVQ